MNPIILTCSNVTDYVRAAQKKLNTSYPVQELDKELHDKPERMREEVIRAVNSLPGEFDTVLIALGYCGGSFDNVVLNRRAVICRVDDCVTMLLTKDDTWYDNLKEAGHLYLLDNDVDFFSAGRMYRECVERLGEKKALKVMKLMFANYRSVDVVETGEFDSRSEEAIEKAEFDARLINKPLQYVSGSNHMIEKLILGKWDEQFVVAEAGDRIAIENFGNIVPGERRNPITVGF